MLLIYSNPSADTRPQAAAEPRCGPSLARRSRCFCRIIMRNKHQRSSRNPELILPAPAACYSRPCFCICVCVCGTLLGHPLRLLPPAELLCSAHLSLSPPSVFFMDFFPFTALIHLLSSHPMSSASSIPQPLPQTSA